MPSFKRIFATLKPWLLYIALFLALRYSGIMSAVASVTQQAIMKTGAMDAEPAAADRQRKFDYNFSLQDIAKNQLDARSLKGKTIFINVWATWCGPCRVEMPSIQSLYDKVDREKVAFIMLSLDQKDPFGKVHAFLRDTGYTFPTYFPSGPLPKQLQVGSIPATFVINKDGDIVYSKMGAANYGTDEFRDFLMGI